MTAAGAAGAISTRAALYAGSRMRRRVIGDDGRLVPRYWDAPQLPYPRPFWRVLLQRHAALPMAEPEPSLCALPLTLQPFTDTPDARGRGAQMFKVGGTPSWAQDDEYYRCAM